MAVIRKQAVIQFTSESGWGAKFRPVYQAQVEASRVCTMRKAARLFNGEEPEYADYLEIGLRPYRLCADALIELQQIDVEGDDGKTEKSDVKPESSEQAMEFILQLAEIDAQFKAFCLTLAEGQKKTSSDTLA